MGENNNPKCPILGRINMHWTSLDATHITDTMIVLLSPTMKNKRETREGGAHISKIEKKIKMDHKRKKDQTKTDTNGKQRDKLRSSFIYIIVDV